MRVVCGEEGDGESGEKDRLLVYLEGEEEEGEGGGDLCVCVCVCVCVCMRDTYEIVEGQ